MDLEPRPLQYAQRPSTKGLRTVRLPLLVISSSLAFVAFVGLWVRSYTVEDEIRWMSGGVHRHLELARGHITYASTSGWSGADYFVWVSSPDLSYGRASDWHAPTPQGLSQRHVRVAYAVPVLVAASVLTATLLRLVRTRVLPPHRHGSTYRQAAVGSKP